MLSHAILNQLQVVRAQTLQSIHSISAEEMSRVPLGFRNSIHWNLGHILIAQEQLCLHYGKLSPLIPELYIRMFAQHSSPLDWPSEPPCVEELLGYLRRQPGYIAEQLGERVEEQLKKPFKRDGFTMHTIGELLIHSMHHEGIHQGIILMLRRASAAEYTK